MKQIYESVNKVMKTVGYVQKTTKRGLNYSYAGEAALIAAIRPAMVDNGLFMAPVEVRHDIGTYTTRSGSEMNHAIVNVTYRFSHVSGETFDVMVTGEGSDVGDKALNKAMTGAYKYALRQTFCIETGDDPDNAPPEQRQAQKKNNAPEKQVANGHNEHTTADIRTLVSEGKAHQPIGWVADKAADTGAYENRHEALNAAKKWDKWPEGFNVDYSQKIKRENATRLFDWLIERKQEVA